MIALKNINKTYNPGTVSNLCLFEDFNLTIETGEFLSVIGSNGSGKTSILNIICGNIEEDSGEIELSGTNICKISDYKRYRKIGRVYQNPSMGTCGSMTILENMAIAENKGKRYSLGKTVDKRKINDYKEQLSILGLGLEDKLEAQVGLLSGGQRQALALLMATMTPIEFLILDEHTAALDPKTAEIIMQLTDEIVREKHLTTIMVTHNIRYALEYGNRVIMMHEGNIVLDLKEEQKKKTKIDEILKKFNEISIECGN